MNRNELLKNCIYSGDLILVNARHGITPGITPPLAPVHPSAPSVLMCSHAADALSRLMREINGWTAIVPVSGWRSRKDQQDIWDSSLKENGISFTQKYVAVPGHSEHQTGLAIDLGLRQEPLDFICPAFPDSGICRVFREKAAGYGFILRYPPGREEVTGIAHEPWHFRYVGTPHAEIMVREGLVLEEYIDLIRKFPHGSVSYQMQCCGSIASVSYIDAAGSVGTVLPQEQRPAAPSTLSAHRLSAELPEDDSCSVSGNLSTGGFRSAPGDLSIDDFPSISGNLSADGFRSAPGDLPRNGFRSVSGNNVDGFIITEWRDADE